MVAVATVTPLELVNAYVGALRDWGGAPLSLAAVVKGPIHSFAVADVGKPLVVVEVLGHAGEEPRAVSNITELAWRFGVTALVRDVVDDPGGAEDLRLGLAHQIMEFHQLVGNRALGGARQVRVEDCEFFVAQYFTDAQDLFRAVAFRTVLRTPRGRVAEG